MVAGGVTIVDTMESLRVLETSLAPSYYIASEHVLEGALRPAGGPTTVCEWKGVARYFDVVAGAHHTERAAWSYPDPHPEFEAIRNAVAFYPWAVEAFVDDERVRGAGRRLLRRLDHLRSDRPVQGNARVRRLVAPVRLGLSHVRARRRRILG